MATLQLKFLLFCFLTLAPQQTGVRGQCSVPPINQAVYEGSKDTVLTCNSWTETSWTVIPTSDEQNTSIITNYDDTVAPQYSNLFDVKQTGLTIKTAQSTPVIPPISTSGLYVVSFNGSSEHFGAKLIVIHEGPICLCHSVNNASIQLSCSITYADSTYHPIYATMRWEYDGLFYRKYIPMRKAVNPNLFTTKSVITVNDTDPSIYQCIVKFTQPRNIQFPYVATDAPEFYQSCTASSCTLANTETSLPMEPSTVTSTTTTSTTSKTSECDCARNSACPSLEKDCTQETECRSGGTNLTDIYDECVVKAELYSRCDNCCPDKLVCGVVVTLRNDSRWLIHDSVCDDNKCQMVVVNASCMSSDWKLLVDRKITSSGVADYVKAGDIFSSDSVLHDCSSSCYRMMKLL